MDRVTFKDILTLDLRREDLRAALPWLAMGTAVLMLAAVLVFWPFLRQAPLGLAVLAGLFYLLAHVFRAIRLAIVSVAMLNVTARTVVALHFATAPVSLFLPFKLGEALRLWGLWRVGGKNAYALVVLLIDRMFDSLFLLPVLGLLLALGQSVPVSLIVLTLVAAVIPLFVVVLGPKILAELQRHVVRHHDTPQAVDLLRRIDGARRIVTQSAHVARRQAVELSVISLFIWLSELVFCALLAQGFLAALQLLGGRLVASWWSLGGDPVAGLALAIMSLSLLAFWPLSCVILLSRWKTDHRRIKSRPAQQETHL